MRDLHKIIEEFKEKLKSLSEVIDTKSVETQREMPEHVEIKFKPASNKFYELKDYLTKGNFNEVDVKLTNHEDIYTLSITSTSTHTHKERERAVSQALIDLKKYAENYAQRKR